MTAGTLVIRRGEGAGAEYPIDGEMVLGREPGSADVVLTDPGISRRHAAIRAAAGRISVADLGSSNGTYVNGDRIRGEAELAAGDEIQLGGIVLSVHPARRAPSARGPAPGRLAPRPDAESNIPAFAAAFLGPLSILLLIFSTGAAFFIALPCAIGAIVLGGMGARRADAAGARGHRALASLGRITGVVGTILSVIAIVAFIVVAAALDATEDSLDGIVDRIREEIEGVDLPDTPETDAPN
ncbi:MAG: FHA domain-containing protein [Solirubrobacterales bacterium]